MKKINCLETEIFSLSVFICDIIIRKEVSYSLGYVLCTEILKKQFVNMGPEMLLLLNYGPFHFGRRRITVKSKLIHLKVFIYLLLIPKLQLTVSKQESTVKVKSVVSDLPHSMLHVSSIISAHGQRFRVLTH
jgi:hypothetical protein